MHHPSGMSAKARSKVHSPRTQPFLGNHNTPKDQVWRCRAQALGPSSTAFPGPQQRAGLEEEQPGQNPAPIWDAGAADGGLTKYILRMARALCTPVDCLCWGLGAARPQDCSPSPGMCHTSPRSPDLDTTRWKHENHRPPRPLDSASRSGSTPGVPPLVFHSQEASLAFLFPAPFASFSPSLIIP